MNKISVLLKSGSPLFIDGAMGTMLQAEGMPNGVNPAEFCMERQDVTQKIHTAYAKAGADIILASTFGGTKYKLPQGMDPIHFNRTMVECARVAAKEVSNLQNRQIFVAGDIGPVGHFVMP